MDKDLMEENENVIDTIRLVKLEEVVIGFK
jgi:hypothetical protein